MTMADAIRSLDVMEVAIERKDSEQQRQWLIQNNVCKANGEKINLFWNKKVKNLSIQRYKHTGLLVKDPNDMSHDSVHMLSWRQPKVIKSIITIKYPTEYEYLVRNGYITP